MASSPEGVKEVGAALASKDPTCLVIDLINPVEGEAPRLRDALVRMKTMEQPWEEFIDELRKELGVRSFSEFMRKFRPHYYYKVEQGTGALGYPTCRFRLDPPGDKSWKKVYIREDDPLLDADASLTRVRALTNTHAINANVEKAYWQETPEGLQEAMRSKAQIVLALYEKMERAREEDSSSAEYLLAYTEFQDHLETLAEELSCELKAIPVILRGLDNAIAERHAQPHNTEPGTRPDAPLAITIGDDGAIFALGPGGEKSAISPDDQEQLHRLAVTDSPEQKTTLTLRQELEEEPLTLIEPEQLLRTPATQRLQVFVDSLLCKLSETPEYHMNPLVANMTARALLGTAKLKDSKASLPELMRFRDGFRIIHAVASQNRLQVLRPLMTTLISLRRFFFEASSRGCSPLVLCTNETLTPLMRTLGPEMAQFLLQSNVQSGNLSKDVIDVILVLRVGPYGQARDRGRAERKVFAKDLVAQYDALPEKSLAPTPLSPFKGDASSAPSTAAEERPVFGQIADGDDFCQFAAHVYDAGAIVCYSPEKPAVSGRVTLDNLEDLKKNYAPDRVTRQPWAQAMVCCPDGFQAIPPRGRLDMGPVKDGVRVEVQVPEVIVPGAVFACALLCRNLSPIALDDLIPRLPMDERLRRKPEVRYGAPCIVDLTRWASFGRVQSPIDHTTDERIRDRWQEPDMPFFSFKQVRTRKPVVLAPRTMNRIQGMDGRDTVVLVHHYQTQVILTRLVLSWFQLGDDTSLPSEDELRAFMRFLLGPGLGWHDPKYVNSFPGKLTDRGIVVERMGQGQYAIHVAHDDPELGELSLKFTLNPLGAAGAAA